MTDTILVFMVTSGLFVIYCFLIMPILLIPIWSMDPHRFIIDYDYLNTKVWKTFFRKSRKKDNPLMRSLNSLDVTLLKKLLTYYSVSFVYIFIVSLVNQLLIYGAGILVVDFFENIGSNTNTFTKLFLIYGIHFIAYTTALFIVITYTLQYKKIKDQLGDIPSKRIDNYRRCKSITKKKYESPNQKHNRILKNEKIDHDAKELFSKYDLYKKIKIIILGMPICMILMTIIIRIILIDI